MVPVLAVEDVVPDAAVVQRGWLQVLDLTPQGSVLGLCAAASGPVGGLTHGPHVPHQLQGEEGRGGEGRGGEGQK